MAGRCPSNTGNSTGRFGYYLIFMYMSNLSKKISKSMDLQLDDFVKSLFENKILLTCGGAYGHLAHPFEDMELTFGDLKDIIIQSLSGKLQATEKTDGINLMFTWKDGQLKAARNKGHLKNLGSGSLTKDQLKQMFADRPENVQLALNSAMNDLEKALMRIPESTLKNIFQDGKRFMSVEVILPSTQNVIPYGLAMLVFHGTIEYDIAGDPTGNGIEDAGEMLDNIIKGVNANVQKNFTIRGPNRLILNKVKDYPAKKAAYLAELKALQGNLPDNTPVIQYHNNFWINFINKKAKEFGYAIPPEVLNDLVTRWATFNKSKTIVQITKPINNLEFKNWVSAFDKTDHSKVWKETMEPFETLFLKLGSEIMSNAAGFLAANPSDAAQQIAKNVEVEAERIRTTGGPEDIKKLEKELTRLQRIGGMGKTVGSEGLTFWKNGKIYKLTGNFAILNQILGIIRYKRSGGK
jgi:hypothetical protein